MALVFKVNGRDLSSYLRVNHGDGLDPAPGEFMDPQYAGSAAMGEGQFFVGDAVNNSAKVFPLILKAATTDLLYQLIRDIRADLAKGNQVEYRSGGASASTFFDLEGGVLDPDFEFWLDQGKRCRATLTIHTRPYGHTGTTRLVGSSVVTGMGNILASGLKGDADAQAVVKIAGQAGTQSTFMYGVKAPVPSGWVPEWRAASIGYATGWLLATIMIGPLMKGASGRLASQTAAFGLAATANYGYEKAWALGEVKLPPVTYAGKHRLFVGARTLLAATVTSTRPLLYLANNPIGGFQNQNGNPASGAFGDFELLGVATLVDTDWKLFDMGELNIPTSLASTSPRMHMLFRGASGWVPASAGASHPIEIEGMFLLPIDHQAGVFMPGGGSPFSGSGATAIATLDGVNQQAIYTNGFSARYDQNLRGDFPGIPVPSGGARVVTLTGETKTNNNNDWVTNAQTTVSVEVRERFTYLR